MSDRIVETRDDGSGSAVAASSLIQTIVWSVVILVLLVVGILCSRTPPTNAWVR